MWELASYYSVLTMLINALPVIFNEPEMDSKVIYTVPDNRIDAANAISENRFPDDFLFGASSSAYQIEGAWNLSGKTPSVWDDFTHRHPELIKDHKNADIASDSYHHYKDDIELIAKLGANSYRISLSWTRILPNGFSNEISQKGVEYYNNVINEMLRRGIEPFVTIYHWDLPKRFQDMGGWTNPLIVDWYVDYARVVFQLFGDRVKMWTTVNEPSISCVRGYAENSAPLLKQPGIADYLCGHYVLLAHANAYRLYEKEFKPIQKGKVGIVMSLSWPTPSMEKKHLNDEIKAADNFFTFWNGWFMNPIFNIDGDYPQLMKERIKEYSKKQGYITSRLPIFTNHQIQLIKGSADFLGVNFYSATIVRSKSIDFPLETSYYNDMGVEVIPNRENIFDEQNTPWALELLLLTLDALYKIPMIYVTENGYGDHGQLIDIARAKYHHEHLLALMKVMNYGVDVRGYFVWSLIDNFEWMQGYSKHFGLFKVDFDDPNRTRIAKLSTKIISAIYKTKKIPKLVTSVENVQFELVNL